MTFSVSNNGRIVTGNVSSDLLKLAGGEYKLFDTAEFSSNYNGVEFYSTTFVKAKFTGTFTKVTFSHCTFVDSALAGTYSDVKFINPNLVNTFPSLRVINSVTGLKAPVIPDGDLIVYKSARYGKLITLRIPKEAKRSTTGSGKCRAEYAIVLSITDKDGNPVNNAYSHHDSFFEYKVGALVKPRTKFDENPWNECSSGIHFFYTLEEAKAWV